MSEIKVTVVPVAKLDVDELESALGRVAKVVRRPVELRGAIELPRGTEDTTRAQHRAGTLLKALRKGLPRLKVVGHVGGEGRPVPEPEPDATIFVTDVDLYTAKTDGAMTVFQRGSKSGIISIRRMREAFYRRKADPNRQRARLAKEILRVVGTLGGLPVCSDPTCVQSETKALADIDRKDERWCATCWKRLSSGAFRL
jgi:predicted Zn-dependent protease